MLGMRHLTRIICELFGLVYWFVWCLMDSNFYIGTGKCSHKRSIQVLSWLVLCVRLFNLMLSIMNDYSRMLHSVKRFSMSRDHGLTGSTKPDQRA